MGRRRVHLAGSLEQLGQGIFGLEALNRFHSCFEGGVQLQAVVSMETEEFSMDVAEDC